MMSQFSIQVLKTHEFKYFKVSLLCGNTWKHISNAYFKTYKQARERRGSEEGVKRTSVIEPSSVKSQTQTIS